MVSILIIDDSPELINNIRTVFKGSSSNIKVSGGSNSISKALPKLNRSRSKVVITSDYKVCINVLYKNTDKKVIFLTDGIKASIINKLWAHNVDAILMKPPDKKEIEDTIHSIIKGMRVIGKDVPDYSNQPYVQPTRITKNEEIVLSLLSKGYKRSEVGEILGKNLNAIDFHCKNIFKKFNKHRLSEVIEIAIDEDLI
jgi:DNA-binding NarL/FixJ family response regulator